MRALLVIFVSLIALGILMAFAALIAVRPHVSMPASPAVVVYQNTYPVPPGSPDSAPLPPGYSPSARRHISSMRLSLLVPVIFISIFCLVAGGRLLRRERWKRRTWGGGESPLAEMLDRLDRNLDRMEDRIGNIETILLDRRAR